MRRILLLLAIVVSLASFYAQKKDYVAYIEYGDLYIYDVAERNSVKIDDSGACVSLLAGKVEGTLWYLSRQNNILSLHNAPPVDSMGSVNDSFKIYLKGVDPNRDYVSYDMHWDKSGAIVVIIGGGFRSIDPQYERYSMQTYRWNQISEDDLDLVWNNDFIFEDDNEYVHRLVGEEYEVFRRIDQIGAQPEYKRLSYTSEYERDYDLQGSELGINVSPDRAKVFCKISLGLGTSITGKNLLLFGSGEEQMVVSDSFVSNFGWTEDNKLLVLIMDWIGTSKSTGTLRMISENKTITNLTTIQGGGREVQALFFKSEKLDLQR